MKISVVILHYKIDESDDERLQNTLKTLDADEIFIADEKTDHVTKKINNALKKCTGDYVVVCGNDNPIIKGSLRDLPVKNAVTVAQVDNHTDCFLMTVTCYPRKYILALNYYDEDIMCSSSDEDIKRRLEILNIPLIVNKNVVVTHSIGGRTTDRIPTFRATQIKDGEYYETKYKNINNNA